MSSGSLMEIEELRLRYRTEDGEVFAVDGVNLELRRNEALVVLGESGCGKSSLAKALLRTLPRNAYPPSGQVRLAGENVLALSEEQFRRQIRWTRMALVMQAAMNALNPVVRVGEQVAEPLRIHRRWSKHRAMQRAAEAFEEVGIAPDFLQRYPHELSGGMRQRAVLAMALVTEPDLIILDEPTSALDVLTQASIMNVLKRIKNERGTSFILITHDVATSSELADRVALMYAGRIVEVADAELFFTRPAHPYSQMLMASVPHLRQKEHPKSIPGRPPSLIDPPSGCRFADRCPKRFARCSADPPAANLRPRHWVNCWLHSRGDS
ncbi:ABC transporter ATP-binding protein [Halorhodospira halochloris]|uniref:Oligopeptide transport ATP-binding protein OppD n=1 Tax=Halorhodospira halochloris TaxID=1052 RepID=A0A0X8X6Z2_HALHR|nr:ABC transporter ATP-binding protein [Halorhodospira halochloris]MBK1650725.1 dipeptide/oligopeptide/nickel ABC transporter ATP-binding protein [Halorhodospira halochloris]MCG5530929.1 ABC transporter ATP-binding protein [Halorhodospira halochloris]MCG5549148.1 ABC transporter ATP-binding protein [Halorhodospira halochloris]BAU56782.1 oligopeptide transport ATP-binding protein OppD [Halorhodospira halochloris]